MPWSIQRRAPEQQDPRPFRRAQRQPIAGPEDQQAPGIEAVPGDLDGPFDWSRIVDQSFLPQDKRIAF